jgi:hypothetical protein
MKKILLVLVAASVMSACSKAPMAIDNSSTFVASQAKAKMTKLKLLGGDVHADGTFRLIYTVTRNGAELNKYVVAKRLNGPNSPIDIRSIMIDLNYLKPKFFATEAGEQVIEEFSALAGAIKLRQAGQTTLSLVLFPAKLTVEGLGYIYRNLVDLIALMKR